MIHMNGKNKKRVLDYLQKKGPGVVVTHKELSEALGLDSVQIAEALLLIEDDGHAVSVD